MTSSLTEGIPDLNLFTTKKRRRSPNHLEQLEIDKKINRQLHANQIPTNQRIHCQEPIMYPSFCCDCRQYPSAHPLELSHRNLLPPAYPPPYIEMPAKFQATYVNQAEKYLQKIINRSPPQYPRQTIFSRSPSRYTQENYLSTAPIPQNNILHQRSPPKYPPPGTQISFRPISSPPRRMMQKSQINQTLSYQPYLQQMNRKIPNKKPYISITTNNNSNNKKKQDSSQIQRNKKRQEKNREEHSTNILANLLANKSSLSKLQQDESQEQQIKRQEKKEENEKKKKKMVSEAVQTGDSKQSGNRSSMIIERMFKKIPSMLDKQTFQKLIHQQFDRFNQISIEFDQDLPIIDIDDLIQTKQQYVQLSKEITQKLNRLIGDKSPLKEKQRNQNMVWPQI